VVFYFFASDPPEVIKASILYSPLLYFTGLTYDSQMCMYDYIFHLSNISPFPNEKFSAHEVSSLQLPANTFAIDSYNWKMTMPHYTLDVMIDFVDLIAF
jgi:hypothetical protein